jgi:two-component system, NarL family, response regulator LiaR
MSRIRIVLADDHFVTREGTRQVLDSQPDMDVVAQAADGAETVRLAQAVRPDLVVLDIAMPILNGMEVARQIRQTLPGTRIVVLTGYDNRQYAEALARLGVDSFLSKTAAAGQLIGAIRAAHAGVQTGVRETAREHGDVEEPTARELEVLHLVAEGRRNREIAEHLCTSERTVEFHLGNLFRKLSSRSRTEVVHRARERGLLA